MPRILIVDDEPTIAELVSFNLSHEGYQTDTALDARSALRRFEETPYDLVILDRMLPGMDGVEVLREIRRTGGHVPVLMLTARGSEADRVAGLEAGADDYLVKPFSTRELVARARAILRRSGLHATAADVRFGDVTLHLAGQTCERAGEGIDLTSTEFSLLRSLVEHRGQAVDREALIRGVWGYDFAGDARTVDVHIRHLREKLEADPAHPVWIETVRGTGYRLRGETP